MKAVVPWSPQLFVVDPALIAVSVTTQVEPGGGQFLLVLRAS